jgi:hypothetical protein
MGDRANIYIQTDLTATGWSGIGIYAHWSGRGLHSTAISHLAGAESRVGDPAYFARIIIQRTLNDLANVNSTTGFGLWTEAVPDNEHPVLVINALTGRYWFATDATYREDEPQGEGNE